jgi:hypothetical protein
VSEQNCGAKKNPPDLLRRVYDIFIHAHITLTSPERKDENGGVMMKYSTFLKFVNTKVAKN